MEVIKVSDLHQRFKAQGVSGREHIATKCPVCSTVQSIASLVAAGSTQESAETMIGYSCEGRLNGVGPWPSSEDKTKKSDARRLIRGCDWTLGGLFRIHNLEVETEDGKRHSYFDIATPDEAQKLERQMAAAQAAE